MESNKEMLAYSQSSNLYLYAGNPDSLRPRLPPRLKAGSLLILSLNTRQRDI